MKRRRNPLTLKAKLGIAAVLVFIVINLLGILQLPILTYHRTAVYFVPIYFDRQGTDFLPHYGTWTFETVNVPVVYLRNKGQIPAVLTLRYYLFIEVMSSRPAVGEELKNPAYKQFKDFP